MKECIILLRGINVGGKNTVSMAELKSLLEDSGCQDVRTYINSGNVLLKSDLNESELQELIEDMLPKKFSLDSSLIKALVLTHDRLKEVVEQKPSGFGEEPGKYHSDVIFLIGISEAEIMPVFNPREGVDTIWQGNGVVYSQRLSAERTKSRLSKIMGTKAYKSMTIRSWNTTVKLLQLSTERSN